jgi:hypothetical protein
VVEWRNETGYPLLMVRSDVTGALCGYVGLPPGHPLHGKHYQEVDGLTVHWGLTFSDACHEGGHICHVPQPGEPADVWWLGFDCGHAGDHCPAMRALLRTLPGVGDRPRFPGESYKTLDYVRSEVEGLAKQLKALE